MSELQEAIRKVTPVAKELGLTEEEILELVSEYHAPNAEETGEFMRTILSKLNA